MKRFLGIMIVMLAIGSRAEVRTWTLQSGETVQGEYVSVAFDRIIVRNELGHRIKLPADEVSAADRCYVELANPPKLTLDLLKSEEQIFVKPSPIWVNNSPVNMLHFSFGARIRQRDTVRYGHDLTVEIYAVAKQVYDPDKYQLLYRWKSEPFQLTEENGRRVEIQAPKVVDLVEYLLVGEYPRGRQFAESLLVVRDERGEIVASRSSKNWLLENLDKLSALPTGAWFDKSCRRVHPTSPQPVWFD